MKQIYELMIWNENELNDQIKFLNNTVYLAFLECDTTDLLFFPWFHCQKKNKSFPGTDNEEVKEPVKLILY